MEDRKIRVAITHGDTNGVGYEMILKAFDDPAMLELCTPIVYGSPKVAAYHRNALQVESNFTIISDAKDAKDGRLNMLTAVDGEVKVELGQQTHEADEAALTALSRAVADYQAGAFDVLVTAPMQKSNIVQLEKLTGESQKALEVLVSDDLRVALVTNNVPLKLVTEAISKEKIVAKGKTFHECLRRDLRISSPRIAVLALNPHGGEDGQPGEEETALIMPAIEELEQQGIQAFGPYPADEFFGQGDYLRFDGVLAMYYDQGIAPFRSLVPEGNVRLATGLSIVSTAPDEGPAFEVAGKNTNDASTMRHAIYLAIDMVRNRSNYDEPMVNPLPKLYKEKRDDSEKVRFAIPKQKEPKREPKAELPSAKTEQPVATEES